MSSVSWTVILCLWTILLFLIESCPRSRNTFTLNGTSVCYWVTRSRQDFEASESLCNINGGLLAKIPNQNVNEEIRTSLLFRKRFRRQRLWIGINDMQEENVFKNSDGSPVSWTNWAIGEPNDPDNVSIVPQDCGSINKNGKWYDEVCRQYNRALCFRTITESTSVTTSVLQKETTDHTPISSVSTKSAMVNNTTTLEGHPKPDVTICKSLTSSNIAEFIPAGAVGIIIGSVVTGVIIILWVRCRPSKHQIQDPRYLSLDENRSTIVPGYDVICTTNPVTRETEMQARSPQHPYITVN